MVLPKEVLLNILLHLRRCDLDWIMLVSRIMCGIVLANNKVLARRVVEKATVHGPIGDGQMSRLRLLFTDPKKLRRRKLQLDLACCALGPSPLCGTKTLRV